MNASRKEPALVHSSSAGGLGVIIVWIAGLYGVEISPEVSAAIVGALGMLAGYLTRRQVTAPRVVSAASDEEAADLLQFQAWLRSTLEASRKAKVGEWVIESQVRR